MLNLVSDLLLSRLDEDRIFNSKRSDLRDLAADALNDTGDRAGPPLRRRTAAPQALLVWGDRAWLQQLVANLLPRLRPHPEGHGDHLASAASWRYHRRRTGWSA